MGKFPFDYISSKFIAQSVLLIGYQIGASLEIFTEWQKSSYSIF